MCYVASQHMQRKTVLAGKSHKAELQPELACDTQVWSELRVLTEQAIQTLYHNARTDELGAITLLNLAPCGTQKELMTCVV